MKILWKHRKLVGKIVIVMGFIELLFSYVGFDMVYGLITILIGLILTTGIIERLIYLFQGPGKLEL